MLASFRSATWLFRPTAVPAPRSIAEGACHSLAAVSFAAWERTSWGLSQANTGGRAIWRDFRGQKLHMRNCSIRLASFHQQAKAITHRH